ncbi:hypothetical protein BST95_09005 [Halioglobus japonicus]|uniref:Uncharacterized protein n=1 Tax=Halioglobus japonicus TaxID=930805 RepID=A0AAP8MEK2_9GAMM|nr:hypothetical protein [Halioglobus japonicus]AQA18349.1 hypothetical protein BST95_09005 [Halioglobus japonicus]PLW86367.1 hypothetical protein C0029_08045 [Halioglobus japonicus]GHD13243.1 hypothetical protein GCM10007052_15170 [Halioglobus japonicus]
MLLGEFAVNPVVAASVEGISDLSRSFGFNKGAVLSEFPTGWLSFVKRSIPEELKESLEFNILVEKLIYLENNALISTKRSCVPDEWYQHAIKDHQEGAFYKVVDAENHPDNTDAIVISQLDENVLDKLGGEKCKRKAEILAKKAELVLRGSRHIKIVDPFFSPRDSYKKTLSKMIEVSGFADRDDIVEWTINTSSIRGGREVCIESEKKEFKKKFRELIPPGKQIEVLWWGNGNAKEIHPRYLITERAGIKYDWGFEEPSDHDDREGKMDIDMMRKPSLDETWEQYVKESSRLDVKGRLLLKGTEA